MPRPSSLILVACTAVLMAALGLGTGSAHAGDNTIIDDGQTFMLGGEQSTELQIRGRNTGNAAVEFLLTRDGKERSIASVAPGKTFELRLPAGNVALLRNASDRKATIKFELTDDVGGLSMRYDKQD